MKKLLLLLFILPLLIDSAIVTNGVLSKGLRFDGGANYLIDSTKYRPTNGIRTEPITVEMWFAMKPIYALSYNGQCAFSCLWYNSPAGKYYGFLFYQYGSIIGYTSYFYYGDTLRTYKNHAVSYGDNYLQIHNWTYLVFPDSVYMYLDGNYKYKVKTTGIRDTSAAYYMISGTYTNSVSSYRFRSYLYALRIYTDRLSEAEIAANYLVGYKDTAGMLRDNLKLCYLINREHISANLDTFYDLSGNGINAWKWVGTGFDTLAYDNFHIMGEQ